MKNKKDFDRIIQIKIFWIEIYRKLGEGKKKLKIEDISKLE